MIKGKRLKELRVSRGLTQTELGKILNITKASVCCYEKETRNPTIETLMQMVMYFGVSADYLTGSDVLVTLKSNRTKTYTMTEEEVKFIEELKKNKYIYKILLEDPERGIELIDNKIG